MAVASRYCSLNPIDNLRAANMAAKKSAKEAGRRLQAAPIERLVDKMHLGAGPTSFISARARSMDVLRALPAAPWLDHNSTVVELLAPKGVCAYTCHNEGLPLNRGVPDRFCTASAFRNWGG